MSLLGPLVALMAALLVGHMLYTANQPSPLVPESEVHAYGGQLFTLKDGRVLEYFDSGASGVPDSGKLDAPILVAVHGGIMTGWSLQGMGLQDRFRVISPTYPGFGASQSNNGRTILSFGHDVMELLSALDVDSFVLAGCSWGGPHSAAIALAAETAAAAAVTDAAAAAAAAAAATPEDPSATADSPETGAAAEAAASIPPGSAPGPVLAWLMMAPAVPAMLDFPGWTALSPQRLDRVLHYWLLPLPLLNRAIMKYIFRPALAQRPYRDELLSSMKPLGSFVEMPHAQKERLFLDVGRAMRWNLDGMPDLAEKAVKPILHIDYPELGHLLGNRPIRIHYGRNDTIVHRASFEYSHAKLVEGGASNVHLLPSEGEEGHLYIISHLSKALDALMLDLTSSSKEMS